MKPTILSFSYKCMKYFRKAGTRMNYELTDMGALPSTALSLEYFFYIGETRDISFSLVLNINLIDLTLENTLLLSA